MECLQPTPQVPVREAVYVALLEGPLSMRDLQRRLVSYSGLAVEAAINTMMRDNLVHREPVYRARLQESAPSEVVVKSAPDIAESARTEVAEALKRAARPTRRKTRVRRPGSLCGRFSVLIEALEPTQQFDIEVTDADRQMQRAALSNAVYQCRLRYGGRYTTWSKGNQLFCKRVA